MEQLRGHIDLLVLAVISAELMHAYALIQRVRVLSEGVLDFADGLVYPVLHKLERRGLIRSDWSPATGRRRRIYSITKQGQAELTRRRTGWERISRAIGA